MNKINRKNKVYFVVFIIISFSMMICAESLLKDKFHGDKNFFTRLNQAVISDFDACIDNYTKERVTYFVNKSGDVYRNEGKNIITVFSSPELKEKLNELCPYPFECIYVSKNQIEYVFAQRYISYIYLYKGVFPKTELTFNKRIERLNKKWYLIKINT